MKTDNEIIDGLGGTSAVSRIFEITEAAVTHWRSTGIPKARLMYLKMAYPKVCGVPVKRTRKALK